MTAWIKNPESVTSEIAGIEKAVADNKDEVVLAFIKALTLLSELPKKQEVSTMEDYINFIDKLDDNDEKNKRSKCVAFAIKHRMLINAVIEEMEQSKHQSSNCIIL
jgi:hypothetical protein